MADVFNQNPSDFINMNDLFPVLNDKVGLTYEQWKVAMENINYLYQRLGISNIMAGNISFQQVDPSKNGSVEISTRKNIVNGETVAYLDFAFYIPKVDTSSFEDVKNKAQIINEQSSENEYPSAKAVYNAISESIIDSWEASY